MELEYRCEKDECDHKTKNNTCRIKDKLCHFFNPVYNPIKHYKSLNDYFDSGDIEIWYAKHSDWLIWEYKNKSLPETEDQLKESHILLGNINITDLNEIYHKLQGEYWSPNGEARELVKSLGLNHTSMSVGDIIKFKAKGIAFIVKNLGFQEIKIESDGKDD